MSVFYHFLMRLRSPSPDEVPPEPDRSGHHVFTKADDGVPLLLVLDADDSHAVETITKGGDIAAETITPIGPQGLAVWYAQRYAELLADGWQPVTVTAPLQSPPHP